MLKSGVLLFYKERCFLDRVPQGNTAELSEAAQAVWVQRGTHIHYSQAPSSALFREGRFLNNRGLYDCRKVPEVVVPSGEDGINTGGV